MFNDLQLSNAARDVCGDEEDLWCAVCGAFDAAYCVYEGRPLCAVCALCWTELGTKEAENDKPGN